MEDFDICVICAYLVFFLHPSRLPIQRKVNKGAVLTYVCTWLSLCHGFQSVMSFFDLSQCEQGVGFNICLYLAFSFISFYSSQSEYVRTRLSMCHVFLLIARRIEGGCNICLYLAFPPS